jgi:hypothetical protein
MEPLTGSPGAARRAPIDAHPDAERTDPADAQLEAVPRQPTGPMRCVADPSVETYLRCGRCEKPICPRCLIQTPVGARCRDCAQLRKLPMFQVGPIDYLRGAAGGLAAGVGGGLALTFIQRLVPLFGFLSIMFLAALGYAVGTAVAKSTRRKQGTWLGIIAAFAVPIGMGVGQGLFFIINGNDPTQSLVVGFALLFRSVWGMLGLLVAMAIAFSRAR